MRTNALLSAYREAGKKRPAPPPPVTTEEPEWAAELQLPRILGLHQQTMQLVTMSVEDCARHVLCLGKTGTGKSTALRYYMRQDAQCGRGLVCLDAHGKLIDDVLRDIPLYRQKDVIYLDLADDDWHIGINLFACPRGSKITEKNMLIDQLLQAFKKCWGGTFATTTEDLLKMIAQTFMDNRTGTMVTIPRFLTDADYRESFLPRIKDPLVKQRWQSMVNSRTGEFRNEDIAPTMRRLYKFLGNPIVRNIVGQTTTTLDFTTWMAENKIVLIKLPDHEIGEEAVQLLGTVILQMILRSAYERPVGSPLWTVYGDEFQHYVTPDITKILQNVRKYGVGLFLATQSFANIADEGIQDGLLGAGTLICYQVTSKDSRIVSGEFRRSVELPEDWVDVNKVRWIAEQSYHHSTQEYRPPNKSEVANRLANLTTLLGMGTCLVKTQEGEFPVTVPNINEIPIKETRANRASIIRESRLTYCRQRFEIEEEIKREILPRDDVPDFELPPEA